MFTTRPPSRSRSTPSRVTKNGAFAFTANSRSYSSCPISSKDRAVPMPALFTRMSTPSA